VEQINLINEALSRLQAFRDANTEAPNYATIETLIDDFVAAINPEVR
jgi:hypothetical protein